MRVDRVALGRHLRSVRQFRALSLTKVADATNISSSFLSQVENGESDISISRLVRLTDYLGVEVSELVDASRSDDDVIVEVFRDQPRWTIDSPGEGIEVRMMGRAAWVLQPSLDRYLPGGCFSLEADANGQPAGREGFIYVIEGVFELQIADEKPQRLGAGEAALFRQRGGRRELRNVGSSEGRLVVVTTPFPSSTISSKPPEA